MKCFSHARVDAVGVCKNCGKGLCKKCAVDLTDGLACKGLCVEKAKSVIELISRNTKITSNYRSMTYKGMVFTFLTGLLFIAFGIYVDLKFIMAIGGLYLFLTLANYTSMRKIS